jgi:hypothetical protein
MRPFTEPEPKAPANPFTERSRILAAERFVGRWAELSLLFSALESNRPVFVSGSPGIGKSSLLTHIVASASANFEQPDLRAFFLRLDGGGGATDVYRVLISALGGRGDATAALEVMLLDQRAPVVLCLDDVDTAIAAGWGEGLLEALARIGRGGMLKLVAALDGPPPALSERFSIVRLGAFAPPELRLLAEAYLEDTGVAFSAADLQQIAALSAYHPAYVQRAAFHLFRNKVDPTYDWRAAYLTEAREQPVPGAPLPPAVFEGAAAEFFEESTGSAETEELPRSEPAQLAIPDATQAILLLLPLLAVAAIWLATGSVAITLVASGGALALGLWLRLSRRGAEKAPPQ